MNMPSWHCLIYIPRNKFNTSITLISNHFNLWELFTKIFISSIKNILCTSKYGSLITLRRWYFSTSNMNDWIFRNPLYFLCTIKFFIFAYFTPIFENLLAKFIFCTCSITYFSIARRRVLTDIIVTWSKNN